MTRRNKRNESRFRNTKEPRLSNATDSVKELLSKLTPGLKRVSEQTQRRDFWRDWIDAHFPAEITGKITGIVEREGVLVLFAESAVWSARLRFTVEEMKTQILAAKTGLTEVNVRVLPRGAKS
jgi:hypothetical protein